MGTVYLAARADDQYQKRVAIKIIRGLDSERIVRHFLRERQILASLDHPHIAKLLDGGTTDDKLPYYVMEYVEGQRIETYCDEHRLSTKERLELFQKVCSAVQYAHRNLVIHRDIKPGNILVTPEGLPKLLDFGIARFLNPELAGDVMTATGLVMTPEYASPEQARGGPLTTATDVYSLGAVLYELLTGHRPYRSRGTSPLEILKAVCDEDPEKPSTAIGHPEERISANGQRVSVTTESVSRTRDGTPERLRRRLRGDLDNILLMALRKEPQRRYASVEALSEDIRRYLEGRPVTARKSTFAYRTGKFLRRNWLPVSAMAVLLAVVLGFSIVTAGQARRLRQERDKASRVTEFLVDILAVADPSEARGNTVTAREVLDKGAERISRDLQSQPVLRAELLSTMARVYGGLGLYETSARLYADVLRLRREALGHGYPGEPLDLDNLGSALYHEGRYAEGEASLREALALGRQQFGPNRPEVARILTSLGFALRGQARESEAEALFQESVTLARRTAGERTEEVADALTGLGAVLLERGRYEEGAGALRESLSIRRELLGGSHPKVVGALSNLGVALYSQGKFDEAEVVFRESLSAKRTLLGNGHPSLASTLNNLGGTLFRLERYTDAEAAYREAIAIDRRQQGGPHPDLGMELANLGEALEYQQRYAEAESVYREALAFRRQTLGPAHPKVATALSYLSRCLQRSQRFAEAEQLSSQAIAIARKTLAPDHPDLPDYESVLGGALVGLRRFPEAEPLLLRSYAALVAQPGKDREVREALQSIEAMYRGLGKPEKAAEYRALRPKGTKAADSTATPARQ